ncbi:MAG TPA: 50S ribosomal protein L29 [Anaerolineae bacterium]|nr:50S ribosomal protein L29 [Anaerolineae bacterium]
MKASELRDLTNGELQAKLNEAYEELMNLRFNLSIGQQKNTNRIKDVKRDIARIKTILRERQLAMEME